MRGRHDTVRRSPKEPTYRLRDLGRAQEILRVCARHGFGNVFSSPTLQKIPWTRATSSHQGPQVVTL